MGAQAGGIRGWPRGVRARPGDGQDGEGGGPKNVGKPEPIE